MCYLFDWSLSRLKFRTPDLEVSVTHLSDGLLRIVLVNVSIFRSLFQSVHARFLVCPNQSGTSCKDRCQVHVSMCVRLGSSAKRYTVPMLKLYQRVCFSNGNQYHYSPLTTCPHPNKSHQIPVGHVYTIAMLTCCFYTQKDIGVLRVLRASVVFWCATCHDFQHFTYCIYGACGCD